MINVIEMYATNSESLNAKLEFEISNAVRMLQQNGSITVNDIINRISFKMFICMAKIIAYNAGEDMEPGDLQEAKQSVAEYIVECANETNK